jgi:hypothetical protein
VPHKNKGEYGQGDKPRPSIKGMCPSNAPRVVSTMQFVEFNLTINLSFCAWSSSISFGVEAAMKAP